METYQYYRDYCALCGKELPKLSMNKIFIGFSHIRYVTTPKTIAFVCDDCLPELYDTLGVIEPDRESKRADKGKPRNYCKKCYTTIGKTALYCPWCGEKVKENEELKKGNKDVNL